MQLFAVIDIAASHMHLSLTMIVYTMYFLICKGGFGI